MLMIKNIWCALAMLALAAVAQAAATAPEKQEEAAVDMAALVAGIKPLAGSINPDAQVYMYLRLYVGDTFSDKFMSKCNREYPKLKEAGAELIMCCINRRTEEAVQDYEMSGCTVPLVTVQQAAKLPGYIASDTSPYMLVVDRQGKVLTHDVPDADESWLKMLDAKPVPKPKGMVATRLKKCKLITGKLAKRSRYFIYISGSPLWKAMQDGAKQFLDELEALRKARVEVVLCCWNRKDSDGASTLEHEGILFPALDRKDARKLPGFDDSVGFSITLVDERGNRIARKLNAYYLENWKQLISDWEKKDADAEKKGKKDKS